MKIVIIGPAWPLRGGIANFNEALARALILEGHEVIIVSFSLQYPSFLFPGKTQFDDGIAPDDLNIVTRINSVRPKTWYSTAKFIDEHHPDLVLVRFWLPFMGPCLGTICGKLRKKRKVIAITDNVIPHEKRPGDKMFTRFFTKRVDGFIAMSRSVLTDLEKFDQQKPKIFLPHPVYNIFGETVSKEAALKKLNLDPQFRYLLFFGIIRKYKGLDILLEALGKSAYQELKIKLIIAGEFYGDASEYKNYIAENHLAENIILHDHFIASEDVKYYFCAADLITQTYRTATQSGVTQIAYHFGRPMLVTDVGGLAETVPDGKAGYVTNTNPAVIAEKINDYFRNNREAEFTNGVLEERKRFDWSWFTAGLFRLSEEIKAR